MAKVTKTKASLVDEALEFSRSGKPRKRYVNMLPDDLRDAIRELAERHASGEELNITRIVEYFRGKGALKLTTCKFYREIDEANERLQQGVK